jgi:hypothetical protein
MKTTPSSHHHQVVSTPGLKWQRGVALLATGDDWLPKSPPRQRGAIHYLAGIGIEPNKRWNLLNFF